jgi:hypothetical protein
MNARILAAAAAIAIAGCASAPPPPPLFVDAPNQTLAPPPPDKAQIVFLEPINAIQGMFPTGVYEIEGDQRRLLAMLASHGKSAQLVAPGHHVFMSNAGGGTAHIMEAEVEAGKRYYVLMRFIYANGMQLRPIRPTAGSEFSVANKDFPEWVSITHFVDKTPDADAFALKWAKGIESAQAAGLAAWQKKSAKERAELTLDKGDAIER